MTFNDPDPKPEEKPAEETTGFEEAFAARSEGAEAPNEPPPTEEEGTKPDASTASDAATEEAAAPTGSTFDPYSGMTPEQKAHWQRVQQSDQSQRGRVSALTRKLQAAPAQPAPTAAAPAAENAGTGNAQTGDDLDAKLKTAAEEYPDAVGPLVEIITAMRAQVADLSTKVQPIADDRSEAELQEAFTTLEAAHPDFRQIAADPSWNAWIEDQPEEIQTLANSFDPAHVAKTIDLFKLERGQATAAPAVDDATEKKRERQLEGSRDVRTTGAPSASGVPNDFDAAFKARSKATA